MMENIIKDDMTVLDIINSYPDLLDVFIANGFPHFSDRKNLETAGKFLKLSTALKTKGYDVETYIRMLEDKLSTDINYRTFTKIEKLSDLKVVGLLPCPVRIPLQEQFTNFLESFEKSHGLKIDYKFEAASIGLDYLKENILNIDDEKDLPDIFISAGFEAFFDKKSIGRFKDRKVFIDITEYEVNKNFAELNIKDPHGDYSIISVVVAVFMVNKKELGDLPVPRSWADLLKPEYKQKVALPVGDFDLFNGILLNIYKEYGIEGVKKLAGTLLKSMHPSQMIKNANMKNAEKPVITIMPYFFTKMVRDVSAMEVVWPEDGAIVSPVFMLVKRSKKDILEPIGKFIAGKEMGEILSHRGLFPSLNKDVENIVPDKCKFKWLGWDFIYGNDIGLLISEINKVFEDSAESI